VDVLEIGFGLFSMHDSLADIPRRLPRADAVHISNFPGALGLLMVILSDVHAFRQIKFN
jgi:hypothetical protein